MSIIIRLQNLPLEANSLDIRRFFQGLSIPDGGVHIVGGEKGDAFIAFGSDEDARQAMERNGEMIKDSRIKLLLSSRNEMQKVIEQARTSVILKPINADAIATKNYVTQNVMTPIQMSEFKNDNQIRGIISPDRRQRERPGERDRIRTRSRSRSPILKSNLTASQLIDSIMQGQMINPLNVREGALLNEPYNQLPSQTMGSRLGYSEALPTEDIRSNQWQVHNNNLHQNETLVQTHNTIVDSHDFNRNGNRFLQTPQSIPNQGFNSERTYTVELRNLPFNITPRDLMDFFNPIFLSEENIKILINDRGLTTGGALVRFNNSKDFEFALNLNGRPLFGRRIDVQPLLEKLPERNVLANQPLTLCSDTLGINTPSIAPVNTGQRDFVLYMKGLPFNQCSERDVLTFFEGINVSDIVIETDNRGKITGNAYAEFSNVRDYETALALNMKHMGRRYIELIPSNKKGLLDARRPTNLPNQTSIANNDLIKTTFCVNITNLPPTFINRDLTSYFIQHGAQPYAIHIMLKPSGLNAGEAYVEFASINDQYIALGRNGDFIANHRISIKPVAYEQMRCIIGKPPVDDLPGRGSISNSKSRNGRVDDRSRPRRDRDDKRRSSFDPRCTVQATNIPYRASSEDICVFFADFGITEKDIERRFNEKGQPTADAKIFFRSPEDASRAVRQMNKKFLIGRPVILKHA